MISDIITYLVNLYINSYRAKLIYLNFHAGPTLYKSYKWFVFTV